MVRRRTVHYVLCIRYSTYMCVQYIQYGDYCTIESVTYFELISHSTSENLCTRGTLVKGPSFTAELCTGPKAD